jgi:hydrogenase/urease accessory protein HupE
MRRGLLLGVLLLGFLFAGSADAHEVRPAYLEIRQSAPETYECLWRVPARGDLRLGLYVRLPDRCQTLEPARTTQMAGAFTEQWSITCAGGLIGETIYIDGLSTTLTDVLVRLERMDGTTQVVRLTPSSPSFVVDESPSWLQITGTYLKLGVEHILLGIDHLLFVLALLILVEPKRRLIATVTAFTVAHSITLAVASLGFVRVPQQPVEAVIALSIVFVASEIAHIRMGRPSLTQQRPWVVAFTFGLLHGFGFAGALREVGLPEQSIPLALLFFNVGVEVGQLVFIAAILVLLAVTRLEALPRPAWAWRVPAYSIGAVASYWTIERVVGFFGVI